LRRGRPLGQRYTTMSYGHAIAKACQRAGVPRWYPHQLRHNAATWLRKEFGLEVARVVLGHRTAAVTEVDAEVDRARAIDVMGRVG
jgi:integrase